MNVETIKIHGKSVRTLKDLVHKTNLKAIFVGISPSITSVDEGHYFQGRQGKAFWNRLQKYNITTSLPCGKEDDAAFKQGFGFTVVVRDPSFDSEDISKEKKAIAAKEFMKRMQKIKDKPLIIFVYKTAEKMAKEILQESGYQTFTMPGPYAPRETMKKGMENLFRIL